MSDTSKDNDSFQEPSTTPAMVDFPGSEEMPQGQINGIPPSQATEVSASEASLNARPQAIEHRRRQAHPALRPHPHDRGDFHDGPRCSGRGRVNRRPSSTASPSRLPIAESYNLFRNEIMGGAPSTLWALDLAQAAPTQMMQSNIRQSLSNTTDAQWPPYTVLQTSDQPANRSILMTDTEHWILMAHPDIAPLRARVLEMDERYADRSITDPDVAPIWADRLALVDQIRSRIREVRRHHGHAIREEARRREARALQPHSQFTGTTTGHTRAASTQAHSVVDPPDLERDLQDQHGYSEILRKSYSHSIRGDKRPDTSVSRFPRPWATRPDLNAKPEIETRRPRSHQVLQNDRTMPRNCRSDGNEPERLSCSPQTADNVGARPASSSARAHSRDQAEVPRQQISNHRVWTQQRVGESISVHAADQTVQREASESVSTSSEVVAPQEEHNNPDASPTQSQADIHIDINGSADVVAGTAVKVTLLSNQTPTIITIHDSRDASGETSRCVRWESPLLTVSYPHPEHSDGAYLEQTIVRPRTPFPAGELSPVADDGSDGNGDYSEHFLIESPERDEVDEAENVHGGSDQWSEVLSNLNARMRSARRGS